MPGRTEQMKMNHIREYPDGTKEWYVNGKIHRDDGPAVEYHDGSKYWYLNGDRHREDGPAVERADGSKYWYLNGDLHREDGPAIEYPDGTKYWYLKGKREYSQEWMTRTTACVCKVIEIDGKRYKLVETKE